MGRDNKRTLALGSSSRATFTTDNSTLEPNEIFKPHLSPPYHSAPGIWGKRTKWTRRKNGRNIFSNVGKLQSSLHWNILLLWSWLFSKIIKKSTQFKEDCTTTLSCPVSLELSVGLVSKKVEMIDIKDQAHCSWRWIVCRMMTFQMLLFYIPMVCLKIRDVIVFTDFAATTKKKSRRNSWFLQPCS